VARGVGRDAGVAADVAGAAGDEDVHGCALSPKCLLAPPWAGRGRGRVSSCVRFRP
jgi:hypothetical protein